MKYCQWSIDPNCDNGNRMVYNTEILKSNIFNFNDGYILRRGNLAIIRHQVTQVAFQNCAPVSKCVA